MKIGDKFWFASYGGIGEAEYVGNIFGDHAVYKESDGGYLMHHPTDWIFKTKRSAARKAIKLIGVNLRDAEKSVAECRKQIAELEVIAK